MTDWKTVQGSQAVKPAEFDTATSAAVVYQRRNIERVTVGNTDGSTTELWQYEERKMTREEYAEMRAELSRAEVAALQASTAPVMAAARSYALTATEIPDASAMEMAALFPTWEDVLSAGAELPAGRIVSQEGHLYRVMQTITPQAHQKPGGEGMLAVYRPIDREHAGTPEDPIPWVYGMDCLAGLYYSYKGVIYRVATGGDMIPCVWAPDTPGLWQWEKTKEVS